MSNLKEAAKPPSGPATTGPPTPVQEEDRSVPTSRVELRRDMAKLRKSLTVGEHSFLESLVVHGNEIEVQIARKRLSDTTIFFPEEKEKADLDHRDDDGFGDSIAIGRGTYVGIEDDSPAIKDRSSVNSSIKVQQARHNRRSSEIHGRIWKAHENGLAVSVTSSRKSVMRRASSMSSRRNSSMEQTIRNSSFLSTSTQDLLLLGGPTNRQGEDNFRESISTIEQHQRMPFNSIDGISPILRKSIRRLPDNPSPSDGFQRRFDGFRRKSRTVSFTEDGQVPRPGAQSFSRRSSSRVSRATMQRLESDLTWGSESGASQTSTVQSFAALQHGKPVRSDSVASIPSLHRAVPVRSESVTSAVFSDVSDPAWSSLSDPAWSSLVAGDNPTPKQLQRHPHAAETPRPMILRQASRSVDQGEGVEVSGFNEDIDDVSKARLYASMLSMGELSTATSWDETVDRDPIFRDIRRTLSDDDNLSSYFLGNGDDASWDMNSDTEENPNAWDVLKDEYASGDGANGTLPFRILGTSADDVDSKPHVLSPPLMESLQNFLPYSLSEDNFWMKYSLVRDGASMHSLLQHIRGARYSIVALETSDGEVFGSFTSEPWRKNWNYFGTGESFLWRMRQSRNNSCHSIIDQAHLESELDVYPWTGENNSIQLCTHDMMAVGGGVPTNDKEDEVEPENKIAYGFGIALDRNLMQGTSCHCATFDSPPLSMMHQDGSPFEIMNLEVWTLTPSYSLEDAEKLELGKLFLSSHQ